MDSPVYYAFLHFYYADRANAAIHMASVKYSPIVFALARKLANDPELQGIAPEVAIVLADDGAYELDRGR